MRNWIRGSFRNRIFAAMLLTALAPFLLGGALMLRLQVERIESGLDRQAELQLEELRRALDGVCASCGEIAEDLSDSTVVRSALHRGGGGSRTLYQVLYRTAEPLRPYMRFDIADSQGVPRYTTGSTLPSQRLNPRWGLLFAAGEERGPVLRAGSGGGLLAAMAVRNYSGEPLGYVTASMDQAGFVRLFDGRYGDTCEVLLLDRQWRTVYCSRPARAEETAAALRAQLLSGAPLTGSGGEYRFHAARHEATGFTLILQQPITFTGQVMGTIYLVSAFVGTLCVVLSLLCTWLLSRYLSRPVYQLDRAMGEVERGRFDVRLETGREDELGRLAGSFNRMTEEYRANLERNLRRQRELNETKLRMMQAQLNPHFLYNTLDTVKWQGVVHHAPQVAELATSLAAILRAAISGDEIIPLDQELDLVERYVEIQSIRFGDRFTCEIDVQERFRGCLVPKLAIQPLVENAILHGVSDLEEGYIKLWAEEQDGDLLLNVSDNGPGIPPDILDKLNSPEKRVQGGHLGLNNVDSIIRLHYGERYGLTARVLPEGGSQVTLRLPMNREEGKGSC